MSCGPSVESNSLVGMPGGGFVSYEVSPGDGMAQTLETRLLEGLVWLQALAQGQYRVQYCISAGNDPGIDSWVPHSNFKGMRFCTEKKGSIVQRIPEEDLKY